MTAVGETDTQFKPLIGFDEATLDSKGRLLLGKKMRDRLGENFAMAIGEMGCICAYPEHRWQERLNQVNRCDPINQGTQDYERMFYATSDDEMSCDAQGRVVIPQMLRELGKLKEKVQLLGCNKHLEVWAAEEYVKYSADKKNYGQERRLDMEDAYKKMRGIAAPEKSNDQG